ncbi:MAG TPA: type II toxin-antitoxin system Phd/YefM family antitoxin [Myxococcota bacterium]|nr:type II toxin-antitoxin system Phd/YefM family antitoxin [Myxococcota bacterium]
MKSVNIAKFKSELSKYLGYVRKGEEILVLDRKAPLARVVPISTHGEKLKVEESEEPAAKLFQLTIKPISYVATESLKWLEEERGQR